MTNNPYTTPQAVEPSNLAPADQNLELASRWARLGASILDGLIMMVIALPVILLIMFFNVNSEEFASEEWLTQIDVTTNSLQFKVISVLIGFVAYLAINGYFLIKSGQTLGKKIIQIQVVDYHTNLLLSPGRIIGLRYVLTQVFSNIPIVGGFFAIINILFIFGNEKRCVLTVFTVDFSTWS